MEGNLTKGPILKSLTKLAIPIMASSFLGTLYNITDMAWIGLLGAKAGFFELMVYILCQITVSMYAITFATYFQDLVPGINLKLVALSILTIIFVTNILGTKNAAIVQKILVIALIAGLGSFILFGLVGRNSCNMRNKTIILF